MDMNEERNIQEELTKTGVPGTDVPEADAPETEAEDELDFDAFRQDALRKKAILERVNKIQRIVTMVITVIAVILILVIGIRKMFPAGGETAVMAAPAAAAATVSADLPGYRF